MNFPYAVVNIEKNYSVGYTTSLVKNGTNKRLVLRDNHSDDTRSVVDNYTIGDVESSGNGTANEIETTYLKEVMTKGDLINRSNKRWTTGSAVPSSGNWNPGDIVWNTVPSIGGSVGWVCVEAGTPGTWKAFGPIQS